MTENQAPQQITPNQAREILWRQGNLTWILDANQKVLYKTYKDSKEKIVVWNCARGSGKSFALCVIAIEECLKNPKALVKYACPKQTDARQIIQPIMRDILESCPDDIRPSFITSKKAYIFPNGAQIQLAGLDSDRAESLRGGSSVLAIVDEAGAKTLKNLDYIMKSILIPAVTRTKNINGKVILASTPPLTETHPFVKYLRRAELKNSYVKRTVYTNPRMTPHMIEQLIQGCGGRDTTDFRREYLCEIIRDENSSVIPEFTEDLQNRVVKEWKRPPFFDGYVAMDLGMKDLTVVLFAYYDFKDGKLIIEDEYEINGMKFNTETLANAIKTKEETIFIDEVTKETRIPYKRVSDNNLIVIQDLWQLHGLLFHATRKDDADAALNNVRILLKSEKIIINPRCTTLIRHLKDVTWNKSKTSFERSADNFHYDAVDSLKYLVRNVDFNKNPYPSNYFYVSKGEDFYQRFKKPEKSSSYALEQMVNRKKR